MPKPAFDPNQPFEQVKPSFDPSQPFEKADVGSDTGGSASASLEGYGQGLVGGHLAHMQAATEPAVSKALDFITGNNVSKDLPDFVGRRDENIARQQKLSTDYPKSYYGGMIGGAITSAPAVTGLLAKAPGMAALAAAGANGSKLARVGQAAYGGGIMGALQNPGDTAGAVNPIQGEDRVKNAGLGAVTGAAIQGAGESVRGTYDFIKSVPEKLKDYAELKAFKATGAMLKDFRTAASRGEIGKLGRAMIDNGMVKPGSTIEDVAEQSDELLRKAGSVIGAVYKKVGETLESPEFLSNLPVRDRQAIAKTALHTDEFSDQLMNEFKSELKGKAGGTKAASYLESILGELKQNGRNANLADVQEFKRGLDQLIKYDRSVSEMPLTKQYMFKVRDFLKDKIQERVDTLDNVMGGSSLESLKEANKQYGIWAQIYDLSKDRVLREQSKQFASLSDNIVGSGGMAGGAAAGGMIAGPVGAVKGAALGAMAGGANKIARTYGNPIAVSVADKAGSALQSIPSIPGSEQMAGLISNNPSVAPIMSAGLLNGSRENQPAGLMAPPPVLGSRDTNRKPAKKKK